MSVFDRIDKAHRRPEPLRLQQPEAGDPCSDPKCSGHYAVAMRRSSDPDRPSRLVMVCGSCAREARTGG